MSEPAGSTSAAHQQQTSLPIALPSSLGTAEEIKEPLGKLTLPLGEMEAKHAATNIPLWMHSSESKGEAVSLSAPVPVQLEKVPNKGPGKPEIIQPIRIGRWFDEEEGPFHWRDEQMARQAAEQKARNEERQKLRGAVYKFLLKEDSAPSFDGEPSTR